LGGQLLGAGRIEKMRAQLIRPSWIILIILSFIGVLLLGSFILQQLSNQPVALDEYPINYLSTRNWLTQNINPYDPVNGESLKRDAGHGVTGDAGARLSYFRYPLLVTLFFMPSAFLQLSMAKSLWMAFSIMCLISGSVLMLAMQRLKPTTTIIIAIALFSALNYFSFISLTSSSLLPLLVLLTMVILTLLHGHHDVWAGVLGTIVLFVFQYGLLIMLFLNIWAARGKRRKFLRTFWAGLVFESAISLIILPTWVAGWLRSILQDITSLGHYASLLSNLISIGQPDWQWIYLVFHLGLLAILVASASTFKFQDEQELNWMMAMIMLVTSLVVFPVLPGSQILCLPAIIFVVNTWRSRWESFGKSFFWIMLTLLMVVPWVMAAFPGADLASYFQGLLYASVGLVGLWWIRWWMMMPRY
jgi:hypothetical protein